MAFQFIAVGTSLGGFNALKTMFGALPKDFPVPIGVVQHRRQDESDGFAPLLASHTQMPVVEVDDKEPIRRGHIYIGPSNYHLLVDGDHFALSTDAPVLHARPSINLFFETAAETFREAVIGVLLTGMSKDGTTGLKKIKQAGGHAVVQDPVAAEGQIMPKAAIASVAIDKVLPLEKIAPYLATLCAGQGIRV
jgi:two-component system chemotaxis response regulator CheB